MTEQTVDTAAVDTTDTAAVSAIETVLHDMAGIRQSLVSDYLNNRTADTGTAAAALTAAVDAGTLPANDTVALAIRSANVAYNRDTKAALRTIDALVSKLTADSLAAVTQVAGISDEHALHQVAIAAVRRARNEIERDQDAKASFRLVGFNRDLTVTKETNINGANIASIHDAAMSFTETATTGKWSGYTFAILNRHNVPLFWLRNGQKCERPAAIVSKK